MNIIIILFFILFSSVYFSLLIFNTNYIGRTITCLVTQRQEFFLTYAVLNYACAYYKQYNNAIQLPFNKNFNLSEILKNLSADIEINKQVDDSINFLVTVYLDGKFIGAQSKIIKNI